MAHGRTTAAQLVDAALDRLVASEECVRRVDLRAGTTIAQRPVAARMTRLVRDLDRALVDDPDRCGDVLALRGAEVVIVLDEVNALLDLTAADDRIAATCRTANAQHLVDLRSALGASPR